MKIIYLSSARLPDEWAHGLQITKMCEAFALAGNEVQLLVPRRNATTTAATTEDPFDYYGIQRVFTLKKLPCLDFFAGTQSRFLFFLRNASFFISARLYLLFRRRDMLYTREPFFLFWMPRGRVLLELHSVPSHSAFFWQVVRNTRYLVAITHGIKEELTQKGVPAGRIIVAPDAVDLSAFLSPESQKSARERLGLPLNEKIALYIGRLDAWKGVDAFYGAAQLLLPGMRAAIIGGEQEEIASLKERYSNIIFLGFRPYRELADNQSAADVLVLPNTAKNALSARYTSPLKLFTYMTSGKPIVASDIPSIREILDENTAILVKSDNAQALAEGIQKVIADPALGARLASAARLKVEQYTWKNRAKQVLSFIL